MRGLLLEFREALLADADWGVRVNASYGIAKLGRDEGAFERERLEVARGGDDIADLLDRHRGVSGEGR